MMVECGVTLAVTLAVTVVVSPGLGHRCRDAAQRRCLLVANVAPHP